MVVTAYPQLNILPIHALEESTYMISGTITDEDGALAVPKTRIAWTLSALIRSVLSTIATGSTASSSAFNTVLSGATHLALQANERTHGLRLFDVSTTYDSSLGNDLPLKDGVRFLIDNLASVT